MNRYYAQPYHDIKTPFSIDGEGAIAEYVINDPENMPQLAMGATILVLDRRKESGTEIHKEFWYSGRVIGLKAVSPFNPERTSMLYREDSAMDPTQPFAEINGPHNHQPMIIRVALTQEISLKSGNSDKYEFSAIQRPPSAYSRLFFPNLTKVDGDNSPSLQTILKVKDKGLNLGMIGFGNKPYGISGDNFIPYKWDIDNLDNKHMFIVGESGSGKTVLLKNLAYQLRKHSAKNKVILTDVQGDIAQLLFWEHDQKMNSSGWQPEVSIEDYQNAQNVFGSIRLLIPKIKAKGNYSDPQVDAIHKLALEKGIDSRKISLRFQDLESPAHAEYLYAHMTSSPQAATLLEDLADGVKNLGDTVSLSRLNAAIDRLLKKNNSNQIVIPSSGVGYYRSTFEACKRILRHLETYFDIDPIANEEDVNPLDAFEHNGVTILYLEHLSQDERFLWEMQLVNWLYNNKKRMPNTYVFIDEAHQVIPADSATGGGSTAEVFRRLRSNFEKLAREGRKFKVNLVLSTQSPQDLHEIVPQQCPTRIVMKINKKNAVAATLDRELAHIANSFSQGQFWIQSPFNGTPEWVRVHSVVPPVPHETMVDFRERLDKLF